MRPAHLTLYHYPISRSMRVKFLLHELLGEDFTTITLDLMRGEGMSAEFMAKNPNHAVPVLEIDYEDGTQQTMIESGAMLIWLADMYPDKNLAPPLSDAPARADYLQIMQFGATWMDMMLWQIRLHRDLLPAKIRSAAQVDLYMNKFKNEVEPQLLKRLEAHDYICGDHFTAADCLMAQNLNWARAYGLGINPVFKAYWGRIKTRPAFALAMADAASFEK